MRLFAALAGSVSDETLLDVHGGTSRIIAFASVMRSCVVGDT